MNHLSKCLSITTFALALGIGVPAFAESSPSFGVGASVPGYCEINATPLVANQGSGSSSGMVSEYCNTQDGFQVVAQHRSLSPGEKIKFSYAGITRNLRRDGSSLLANRSGAKNGIRPISVRYSGLGAPLSIALTVTAY